MTRVLATTTLKKAKRWAEKIWTEAIASWSERPAQDYAYRKLVVEPPLSELIAKLDLNPLSLVIEIGCGDGAHSIFWRQQLNSLGLDNVQIFGVDLLEPLIVKARENAVGYKNISFEVADVTDINIVKMIHDKFGIPEVIVAMFLLQDVPDLEGVLKMIESCLKENGHFIAVFVHPDFAKHLFEAGYVKRIEEAYLPPEYITDSGIVQWRFVGYYPIARTDNPPFYLPYFHRFLKDYRRAFEHYRLKIIDGIPLMLNSNVALELQGKRVAPFYEDKWNIYWPLIINEPSSMLIHAIKGKNEKNDR
jgi:SAM-dependent methyltransferase